MSGRVDLAASTSNQNSQQPDGTRDVALVVRIARAHAAGYDPLIPTHRQVFHLARNLKARCPALPEQPAVHLTAAAEAWWAAVEARHPSSERWTTADEVAAELVRVWPKVLLPAGEQLLTAAAELSQQDPPPPAQAVIIRRLGEEGKLPNDSCRRLAAFCLQLACLVGGEFFLSCRAAGEAIGVSRQSANVWLNLLVSMGVLELLAAGTKGRRGRAARYAWRGPRGFAGEKPTPQEAPPVRVVPAKPPPAASVPKAPPQRPAAPPPAAAAPAAAKAAPSAAAKAPAAPQPPAAPKAAPAPAPAPRAPASPPAAAKAAPAPAPRAPEPPPAAPQPSARKAAPSDPSGHRTRIIAELAEAIRDCTVFAPIDAQRFAETHAHHVITADGRPTGKRLLWLLQAIRDCADRAGAAASVEGGAWSPAQLARQLSSFIAHAKPPKDESSSSSGQLPVFEATGPEKRLPPEVNARFARAAMAAIGKPGSKGPKSVGAILSRPRADGRREE